MSDSTASPTGRRARSRSQTRSVDRDGQSGSSSPAAEYVDPSTLVPWSGNPRSNDGAVAGVVESIRRFGFGAPIVARRENRELIKGHTRLKAAIVLGLRKVPVRWMDLSEGEAHALALADNRLGEIAQWDDNALKAVLNGLVDLDVPTVDLGWSLDELNTLLADVVLPPVPQPPRPDVVDPGPEVPPDVDDSDSVLGGRYELGPHVLVCGDALDPAVRATALDGRVVDVLVLDPPYEMDGSVWTTLMYDPSIVFGQARHIRRIPDDLWRFERVIDKVTAHRSATVQIGHQHAFVVQVGSVKTLPTCSDTFPSIVRCPNRPEHPHEKPVDLLVEHLTHWTPPWATVADWFAGSGSTLIAAAQMGRVAVLVELSPACCDAIRRRWTKWAVAAGVVPGPGALDAVRTWRGREKRPGTKPDRDKHRAANRAVKRAIADGKIDATRPCEVCGSAQRDEAGSSWVVQHHHDYALQLDTIPLCRSCHQQVHRGKILEPRTGRRYEKTTGSDGR